MSDECKICKDSSEFIFRLKKNEQDLSEHKIHVEKEFGEMKEELQHNIDSVSRAAMSRIGRIESAIWGLVITALLILLDTVAGKW